MPRWLTRTLWMLAQAAAIGGLTWIGLGRAEPVPPPVTPASTLAAIAISVILVAFLTALITNLWDWAHRKLQGLRRPGLTTVRPEDHEAVQQRDGRSAWLRRGELGKPPSTLR